MIMQKHKSIKPNPGVKRIQNYIFKFNDFLGKGNFSTVYKGINQLTKQTVAIKYIALNSLTCERLKQLLDQQIQIFTSLNHPNIVKCFEVLKSAHNCYIVTQLCDGGDLQTLLKKKRLFTQDEAIPFIRDIFEGLYYLSKKNIIHRDIKLANIFLNNGKPKLADFGFAQRSKKQFNDGKIGTPLCMSPEGFLQNLYGSKTDVWAFGIILYQLTHGRLHLDHCTTQQMLRQQIRVQMKLQQLKPQLNLDFKQFILRCLDVNPCTRITFQEMKNHPFIQRITGNRIQTISMQDLKYIPSFHSNLRTSADQNIVSLRNLQHPHFEHLQTKQKIQLAMKNEHLNFQYGTKRICEDSIPQNIHKLAQKNNQKCICRPSQIKVPVMTYIPSNKKYNGSQSPSTISSPLDQSQQYEIRVSHKSSSNFPVDNDFITQTPQKQEKSMISTTDRDFLQVPSPMTAPFRRHKGSFQMTAKQNTQVQQKNNLRATVTTRKSFQQQTGFKLNEIANRTSTKLPMDVCPITNTKRFLNGFIKFNEAIGIIHYCRLIYKYIIELKNTGIYHVGDLNLRYYSNYLLNLLNQLDSKVITDHIILSKGTADGQTKQNKLAKMQKVIVQYMERYKPNIQKQRGDYLNRNTEQIKQILQLDRKFIDTFYIPDKTKIQNYNQTLAKFTQILQKANRMQRYTQFDSNKQLESATREQKKQPRTNQQQPSQKSVLGRYEPKSARLFV